MAGGGLVPVEVSPGVIVQMPEYLVPPDKRQASLGVPNVGARPAAGPDNRLADSSGMFRPIVTYQEADNRAPEQIISDALAPPQANPELQIRDFSQDKPLQITSIGATPTKEEAAEGAWRAGLKPGGKQSAPKAVDPSSLVQPGQARPSGGGGPGTSDDDVLNAIYQETMRRGGGGGRPRQGPLAPTEVKQERTGGRDLIPELRWKYGLEQRPDLGQELDPNAEQPTWGTEDPITRDVRTPLEQAATLAGDAAERQGQRAIEAEQLRGLAQQSALAQQSEALDQQLAYIAEKRDRIATLQEAADKRMMDARSFEPRSRQQIWDSKGPLGQVMGILSMAIGGYAAGTGRTRNAGWDMINKVLDDAAADDVAKWNRKRDAGLQAKGDLTDAMRLYGDLDAAALDAKQRKLSNVIGLIDTQLANRALDEGAKDQLAAIRSAAEDALLERAQQLNDMIHGTVTKEEVTLKPQQLGSGGGGTPTTLKALQAMAAGKKALNTIRGMSEDLKPSDLKEVNKSDSDLAPVKEMLNQYRSSDNIPGLAEPNVASRGVRGFLDWAGGAGTGERTLDSEEERKNRQVGRSLVAGVIQSISGAGVSNEERAQLNNMVRGARTKQDFVNIVHIIESKNREFRRLAGGGSQQVFSAPSVSSEEAAR